MRTHVSVLIDALKNEL